MDGEPHGNVGEEVFLRGKTDGNCVRNWGVPTRELSVKTLHFQCIALNNGESHVYHRLKDFLPCTVIPSS